MPATWLDIDWDRVDELLIAGCSSYEIAGYLGCHPDTIRNNIKRQHGVDFREYKRLKRAKGDSMLREKQLQMAMSGDKTMLVFLGKNRLGQRDKFDMTTNNESINPVQVIQLPHNGRDPLPPDPSESATDASESD